MPTLSGLRRCGYTPTIINTFCQELDVTCASNVVELDKLEQTAHTLFTPTSTCTIGCLHPIMVQLVNLPPISSLLTYNMNISRMNPSLGFHTVTLTLQLFYIDSSDFSLQEESNSFYGLTPHTPTGLKCHGGSLSCEQIMLDCNDETKVEKLICALDYSESRPMVKSYITWVPSNAVPCEV